jgi:hypothetical protein
MDAIAARPYVCPLCWHRTRGVHRCAPLNNWERWAIEVIRQAIEAGRKGST